MCWLLIVMLGCGGSGGSTAARQSQDAMERPALPNVVCLQEDESHTFEYTYTCPTAVVPRGQPGCLFFTRAVGTEGAPQEAPTLDGPPIVSVPAGKNLAVDYQVTGNTRGGHIQTTQTNCRSGSCSPRNVLLVSVCPS